MQCIEQAAKLSEAIKQPRANNLIRKKFLNSRTTQTKAWSGIFTQCILLNVACKSGLTRFYARFRPFFHKIFLSARQKFEVFALKINRFLYVFLLIEAMTSILFRPQRLCG